MVKKKIKLFGFFVLIVIVVLFSISPFLWQIITSLKSNEEIFSLPISYFPHKINFRSYIEIFTERPFGRYILNSLFVASCATLLCVFVSSLAAYAIARIKIKGGNKFLLVVLVVAFFPQIIYLIPLYELFRVLGLFNNPIALILPYATINLPFGIWVLTSFFKQIPKEIEDAAKVDGFSRGKVLFRIILPLSAPALATTAILVFILCWNEFLFALTFMIKDLARTVPVGIAMLSGASMYEIPWDKISAATVITTLPLVIITILFQRRIVEGLTAGAVKG
ncbi:carbohydrate ABC transporter permease [candidate division WOR-3 bacterium]|nr:carbohydrate ABC transporter permease [candidate division WOR-3 bacterium]